MPIFIQNLSQQWNFLYIIKLNLVGDSPGFVFWGVGNFNVTNVRRDRWEGQNLANMELIDENLCAKITTHPSNWRLLPLKQVGEGFRGKRGLLSLPLFTWIICSNVVWERCGFEWGVLLIPRKQFNVALFSFFFAATSLRVKDKMRHFTKWLPKPVPAEIKHDSLVNDRRILHWDKKQWISQTLRVFSSRYYGIL